LRCVRVFVAVSMCICCVWRCQRSVRHHSNFPLAWNMDLQSRGVMWRRWCHVFNAISAFMMVEVVMTSAASVHEQNLSTSLCHLIAPTSIASISRSNMRRDGSNIKAYLKLRSRCSSTDRRWPLSIGSFAWPMMS